MHVLLVYVLRWKTKVVAKLVRYQMIKHQSDTVCFLDKMYYERLAR